MRASGGGDGARRQVAAGAARLLSSRILVALLAVIFIAISTRILTLREMAVFALYNTLCALQAVLCSMGLLTTCTRQIPAMMGAGDADGAARLLRTAMATNAVISATAALILGAAARPLSLWLLEDPSYAPALRWAALGVFAWNLFEANQIFLVSLQRFGAYARATITCAVAQRAFSLGLFLLLAPYDLGLLGYMAGFALGSLAAFARSFGAIKDLAARPVGLLPLGPLLRYSRPFYADGYLRWLYMQADQLLVAIFLSPEILSLYFVAKRFIQYYQQVVSSTIDPVLAKVGQLRAAGLDAVERSLGSASRYFSLVFVPLGIGTAAMSIFFLDLAGGDPYREAAPLLAILSLSVTLYAAFNLVTGYVYMLGEPLDRLKYNMVTGLTQLAMMAGLMAALRPSAGMLAAAAALAGARWAALATGLAYGRRQLARYIAPRFDLGVLPRALAASLLMAAVAGIPQLIRYSPFTAPLWGAAGAALFVLIIRPAVRPEDLDLVTSLLGNRLPWLDRALRRIFTVPS